MYRPPHWLVVLILTPISCLLISARPRPVTAQETAVDERTPVVSADVIRSRLQSLDALENLDEAARTRVTELYQQILTDIEAGKSFAEDRQQWLSRATEIPGQVSEITRQLGEGTTEVSLPDTSQLSQEELDKKVTDLQQTELPSAQSTLSNRKSEAKRRSERRLEAPKQIANLTALEAELERKKTSELARTDISSEQREAERLALDVKLENVALELRRIQDELAYYDASEELLDQQIKLAEQTVARVTNEAKAWAATAERKRSESAAEDVGEKKIQASDVPSELKPLADENVRLSEKLSQLATDIEETNKQFLATQASFADWSDQVARARALIDSQTGVSESVGNLLRQQRQKLPDAGQLRKQRQDWREALYAARSDEFTTAEQLANLSDLEARLETEMDALAKRVDSARVAELKPGIRSLLEARQETLKDLQRDYKTHIEKLVGLGIQQDLLISLVGDYTNYVDQRILWIRSTPPVQLSDVLDVPAGLRWLLRPKAWHQLLSAVRNETQKRAFLHLAIVLILIVCFAYRSHGVREIQILGEKAATKGCRNFSVTVKALLWTLAVSAAGPALLSWISWTFFDVARNEKTEFAEPLATATLLAAVAYWPSSFWMNIIRRKGLAEAHFQWSPSILKLVRRHLGWFVPTIVALTAGYCFFNNLDNLVFERSLARLSLFSLTVCSAVFLGFILSPKTGTPREFLALHRDGWLDRLRYVWYTLILAIPFAFAVQTLLGYQYTAERLTVHLFWSLIYLSALYIVEAILSRWILINRRRLAIAQAKERLLSGGPSPQERDQSELQGGVTENTQVNLTQVNAQTQRLLNTFVVAAAAIGLYLIWIEALPALARMNDVRLWRYAEAVPSAPADSATTAAPTPSSARPDAIIAPPQSPAEKTPSLRSEGWVTLGNLVGSLLLLGLTYAAVRNIPGLLEIAILQHLPLDASIRFAITTVTRYALIITGTAWAFTNIGFGWSKIQWLAAAISVGLGFGLQEIFANFVSGLILLFERPLRVGDIVTVGDVTGAVVQIRTRATTIRNWDRKELIVPNKEFITGELLNWTLTDETNRVVLNVGIAYGSDIRRAREIVLAATAAHPLIMQDPPPTVTCDLFGDSALQLTVRCVLARMDDRLPVIHELHEAIHDQFAAAGISIPFPQRDIHVHLEPNDPPLPRLETPRGSIMRE